MKSRRSLAGHLLSDWTGIANGLSGGKAGSWP